MKALELKDKELALKDNEMEKVRELKDKELELKDNEIEKVRKLKDMELELKDARYAGLSTCHAVTAVTEGLVCMGQDALS